MSDTPPTRPVLGATPLPDESWQFAVWAPQRKKVELRLLQENASAVVPREPSIVMERDTAGYYRAIVSHVAPGSKYMYRLDGSTDRPDPASRFQPDGVHGASQLTVVSRFAWSDDAWRGLALEDHVFYELHVGTCTSDGTFAALIPRLDTLSSLGVTTVELMPIAQFPGTRNWGYDGVYPFATHNTYGSPRHLQNFVNAAHARGLAVALDVVYNHLGPEGNYLAEFGPYFTDHYRTPWGSALNFDGPYSDEVRYFFIQSALYWLAEFHIDALRLDAIHGIFDASAYPFLAELSDQVASFSARSGRRIQLIAESDLNDARVVRDVKDGGFGMHSQWSDDFHHSVHALLTGENTGYYADFGGIHHLATTLKDGWYYGGHYSRYRNRRHGNRILNPAPAQFVVCAQNHDQVGNRALGDRLSTLVDFEGLKLIAGITVLSSFLPLLFMGEEYGETSPFLYFTSHTDPQLAEAVRQGRKSEFISFGWRDEIPDPQAESTFAASKLDRALAETEPHRTLLHLYQKLLRFRRDRRLAVSTLLSVSEFACEKALFVLRSTSRGHLAMIFNFGESPATLELPLPPGSWQTQIDSSALIWRGQNASVLPPSFSATDPTRLSIQPRSFLVLEPA
jgi:maltooligosyltrehalose trehalohydrolase